MTGEAGLGKTSFVKMIASEIATHNGYPIYIPVNSLRFDTPRSAWNAIVNYISFDLPDRLGFEPSFDEHSHGNPIILIIDGLDELSRSGQSAEEAAHIFLDSLKESLREVNDFRNKRVLVLLAGRPKVTVNYGGQFNEEGQIVFIERLGAYEVPDPDGISDEKVYVDLRARWWQNFRNAIADDIGTNVDPESLAWLPEQLTDPKINTKNPVPRNVGNDRKEDVSEEGGYFIKPKYQDFIDQPLLCYFVAVLLYTDQERFSGVESRSDLFEEMFNFFYVRQKAKEQRAGSALQHVFAKQKRYRYLLELIALAAWCRGDRSVESTLVDSIFQRDREARRILYATFDESVSYGSHIAPVTSGVINSFFVGKDEEQPAGVFEFTHKAFREYLSTSRLVKVACELSEGINDHSYSGHEASLRFFQEYLGCQLSPDIIAFLQEIFSRDSYNIREVKKAFEKLFNYVVLNGAPPEVLKDATSGRQAETDTKNIELLIFFSVIAACWHNMYYNENNKSSSFEPGEIDYICIPSFRAVERGHSDTFGNWIHRVRGQTETWRVRDKLYVRKGSIPLLMLSGIDLTGANLVNQDFENATMNACCMQNANLLGAMFRAAILQKVDFRGADLRGADFSKAYIGGAIFTGACVDEGQFEDCVGVEDAVFGEDASE